MKKFHPIIAIACRTIFVCALLLCGASSVVHAQTTWTGGASPDLNWSTGNNWSSTTMPGSGDSVVFNATGTVANSITVNNIVDGAFPGAIAALSYVNSASGNWQVTQIPTGQTLSVSGATVVGGLNADGIVTLVAMTGGGTFAPNGSFKVGNAGSASTSALQATLDMSALSNFVYNVPGGTWIVAGSGTDARGGGVLNFAGASNNVTVGTINFNTGSGNNSGFRSLMQFGSGTNILNVGTFVVTQVKAQFSNVQFQTNAPATAGLRIRGVNGNSDDSSRANITLGDRNNTGGGNTEGNLLLNGHPVDIKAGTIIIGQDRSGSTSATHGGVGILQFDNGVLDVTNIIMAACTTADPGAPSAVGTLTVGANGKLYVGPGGISIANRVNGTATGTINILGGTVVISNFITKATSASTGIITMTNGTLTLTTGDVNIGSSVLPINTFSMSDSTLNIAAVNSSASVFVGAASFGGTSNVFNFGTIPSVTAYPSQFPVIQNTTPSGTFNGVVGTLPGSFEGYMSNNVTAGTVDLVVTNGPSVSTIRWQGYGGGSPNSSWDTTTFNWRTLGGLLTNYVDGRLVQFDDSASNSTVSLVQDVSPGQMTFTNNVLNYTINGSSKITGTGGLTKRGSGNLVLANSGVNDFNGGLTIDAGTLQIGNNDNSGNIPAGGNIVNNGAIVFTRSDTSTVGNDISGSGSITQFGGTLQLGGFNSFTGPVLVTNSGILKLGSSAALQSDTTIGNGSVLDFNGFTSHGKVVAQGTGAGSGALNNSGGAITGFIGLTNLTLAGDTTFGTSANRWDLRSPGGTTGNPGATILSTGGNAYNITKIGTGGTGGGLVALVSVTVDPMLADINIQEGVFDLEGNTTGLGNPANNLSIQNGATFQLFAATNQVNKHIILTDGGTIANASGANTIIGPINIDGFGRFVVNGTSLTLSNALTGSGTIYKITGTNTLNINGTSPDFAGSLYMAAAGSVIINGNLPLPSGVQINIGKLVVNGQLLGEPNILASFVGPVAGRGYISGSSDLQGPIYPGDAGTIGTLTFTNLTTESSTTPTFDLTSSTGVGGGTNDLIVVNGNLVINGGTINVNTISPLQTGVPYRLFNYSGSLTVNTPFSVNNTEGYTFVINTSTAGQVNLIASGGAPTWNGGSATGNNWSDSANWNGVSIVPDSGLLFGGTTRLNNTNDTTAGTSYGDIIFTPTAGSFVLNGNAVTMGGDIVNNSTNAETVNLPLTFGGARTLNGASGTLIIGGGITNTANLNTLTLSGNGILTNLLGSSTTAQTNTLATSAAANWTLVNNPSSTAVTAPWLLNISSGTFSFGTVSSAPVFSSTTLNGAPQDFQVGASANSTAVFNMNNGTLTTLARFNTAVALNSTGIVNQAGGTLTIASQFQGANGSNLGEQSIVNLSGGTMNIGTVAAPTAPFYVGSRGNGILTVTNTALLNCGNLDVARNASGNTFGSIGVVNLDGGTIVASRVGTATANSQTGPPSSAINPSATFNFNGGTLKARGASTTFLQGAASPAIPITTIVKARGAIIDDGGFAITIGEPMQHDSGLGATPDGGLTKNGNGTLTLSASNSYTGNTLVNTGTLAVNGSLAATPVTVAGGTLAGTGTIGSNVTVNANGTLSPSGPTTVGTLTVNGNVLLQAGSTNFMTINKSVPSSDLVRATAPFATTITYGGTLVVSNLAGSLAPTDTFKLFSATNYSNSFTAVVPDPGAGLTWDTSTLNTDGTLRLISGVNTQSTNITTTLNGNVLTLAWPADHIGWRLQVQTNSLNVGLNTNWVDWPDSGAVNSTNITINPANGAVFYRLVYP